MDHQLATLSRDGLLFLTINLVVLRLLLGHYGSDPLIHKGGKFMPLFFRADQIGDLSHQITYADVTLVPCFSTVPSRKDPKLTGKLTRLLRVAIPIIPANMLDISGPRMVAAMYRQGAAGILHRGTSL